ncbi:hypothetical protein Pelo_14226 [Pelomyxa schiedti]|nr:hypothetical protein Pelo_14226 [Pelomyxa schiedti]
MFANNPATGHSQTSFLSLEAENKYLQTTVEEQQTGIGTVLLVANLVPAVKERDLMEIFGEFFPKNTQIATEHGVSLGYALIEFSNQADRDRAIYVLEKVEVEGRELFIKPWNWPFQMAMNPVAGSL